MPGRVEGKVAVVIGAGQTPGSTIGNGKATAVLLAREGASVVCVDMIGARAEETASAIRADGGNAWAVEADITNQSNVDSLVEQVLARHGRIDILINNVGIGGGGDARIDKVDLAALERILAINLTGLARTTKAVLPAMQEQGKGAIVNISSAAAVLGGNFVAYEMSKAALNRLTTSTAQSQARFGIRANAIQPGFLDTPMAIVGHVTDSGLPEEQVRAARNAMIPLGKQMGTAWDLAYAALFLGSDEAGHITGVVLPIDGGLGVVATP